MARRPKKKSGEEGPAWLITFSDMMTLLLTFFVLLLSMAVIDERSKLVVLGSVAKSFAFGKTIFNPMAPEKRNTPREPGVMNQPDDDLAVMRDMVYDDVEKDLDFQENKYVQIFSISSDVLFKGGESELSLRGVETLDRIVPYLHRIDYPLLVAGHTATRRDEDENYRPSDEANREIDPTWRLSYLRAMSVYRHLTSRSIDPGRLSLEGFGQYHPRHSNNTPEGRRKNRRVDLVLDKRNLDWIKKVEATRLLDPTAPDVYYKGFRFDIVTPGAEPGAGLGAPLGLPPAPPESAGPEIAPPGGGR